VCALDVFLQNEHLKSLVARMGVLPSLPSLYFKVLQELQSPTSSVDRIGELVAMDIAMSAKLLQLVNSAFFGIRRKVSNPAEAVQFLGVGTVRSLALSIHAFSCFDQAKLGDFSFERLWNHCVTTGLFARKITDLEEVEPTMSDESFIAGLLHDVGKLMLITNMTEDYRAALALAQGSRISINEAERKVFGATHADVGAYLLGLWGLPVAIVEAVALHHEPSRNVNRAFSPLTAVHVANVLEHEQSGAGCGGGATRLDEAYLTTLKLSDRVHPWRQTFAEMVQQGVSL
jgi:HD-like signal output (HDOD) protein